jgi:hypothetical protein
LGQSEVFAGLLLLLSQCIGDFKDGESCGKYLKAPETRRCCWALYKPYVDNADYFTGFTPLLETLPGMNSIHQVLKEPSDVLRSFCPCANSFIAV